MELWKTCPPAAAAENFLSIIKEKGENYKQLRLFLEKTKIFTCGQAVESVWKNNPFWGEREKKERGIF